MNEGTQEKIGQLYKKIEQITHMGKEPIIAVIERYKPFKKLTSWYLVPSLHGK